MWSPRAILKRLRLRKTHKNLALYLATNSGNRCKPVTSLNHSCSTKSHLVSQTRTKVLMRWVETLKESKARKIRIVTLVIMQSLCLWRYMIIRGGQELLWTLKSTEIQTMLMLYKHRIGKCLSQRKRRICWWLTEMSLLQFMIQMQVQTTFNNSQTWMIVMNMYYLLWELKLLDNKQI